MSDDVAVSEPAFRTLHALRIKGFAKVEVVAEIADVDVHEAREHLVLLAERQMAMLREARELWQLTPAGRDEHAKALADDVLEVRSDGRLGPPYAQFLALNDEFKVLCGDWQLVDGKPNSHDDAAYDRAVIRRLALLNRRALPVVHDFGGLLSRLLPYGPRLAHSSQRVANGETNMFTGVMCGSYHDVWMELHEDLILTQGLDRCNEGSF